jgi:hypothetical protein
VSKYNQKIPSRYVMNIRQREAECGKAGSGEDTAVGRAG